MKIFHIDMNSAAFQPSALKSMLDHAAASGFDSILWEVENKIQWRSCPECVDSEAMSRAEFCSLLDYSRSLGLKAIPLLQTFGHAEYVLQQPSYYKFRELPDCCDCYCPSNPGVRELLSRWIEEYLEIFGDIEYFHLGGDEAYHLGKCPVCSQRALLELYSGHLKQLAAPLIARHIRPCIWHDVISGESWWMRHEHTNAPLGHEFLVWYWDYQPEAFANAGMIRKMGFEQIICCSGQSFGDDPLLVNYQMHMANIESASRIFESVEAKGICFTSWSVRMGLKQIQYPLLTAFASGKLPGQQRFFQAGAWDKALSFLLGIMWSSYKDGQLPPADYLREQLAKHSAELSAITAQLQNIYDRLPVMHGVFQTAIELKRRWLVALLQILSGRRPDKSALLKLRDDFAAYYGLEQRPLSARRNAAIIINPLIDYCGNNQHQNVKE